MKVAVYFHRGRNFIYLPHRYTRLFIDCPDEVTSVNDAAADGVMSFKFCGWKSNGQTRFDFYTDNTEE